MAGLGGGEPPAVQGAKLGGDHVGSLAGLSWLQGTGRVVGLLLGQIPRWIGIFDFAFAQNDKGNGEKWLESGGNLKYGLSRRGRAARLGGTC